MGNLNLGLSFPITTVNQINGCKLSHQDHFFCGAYKAQTPRDLSIKELKFGTMGKLFKGTKNAMF